MASAAVAEDRPLRTLALTVRRRIGTTPGRLRFAGALLVMASVVFGAVRAGGAAVRHSAAHSAATASEPLLVHVENFYSSLADADATAASTFATGGVEPAARRARYLRDLRSASADLAAMSHRLEMSGQAFAPHQDGAGQQADIEDPLGRPRQIELRRHEQGQQDDRRDAERHDGTR